MPVFEWNKKKARYNLEKHGVSFDEGTLAFDDPHRLIIEDGKHSEIEERWVCLGGVMAEL